MRNAGHGVKEEKSGGEVVQSVESCLRALVAWEGTIALQLLHRGVAERYWEREGGTFPASTARPRC